jgi:hypothetical protein
MCVQACLRTVLFTSALQPRFARLAGRFGFLRRVAARLPGLLIPRSQVRVLPGPCGLQGFCARTAGDAYVCAYVQPCRLAGSAPDFCCRSRRDAVRCRSLQLVQGDFWSHSSASDPAALQAAAAVSRKPLSVYGGPRFESLPLRRSFQLEFTRHFAPSDFDEYEQLHLVYLSDLESPLAQIEKEVLLGR